MGFYETLIDKGQSNRNNRASRNTHPGNNEDKSLANSPQAKKRARQAEARRRHNAGMGSMVRTNIKKVLAAIHSGDREAAQAAYASAVPIIDRMADKGILHKNKAARHKNRLNAQIKAIS